MQTSTSERPRANSKFLFVPLTKAEHYYNGNLSIYPSPIHYSEQLDFPCK